MFSTRCSDERTGGGERGANENLASLVVLVLIGALRWDVHAVDAEHLHGGGLRQGAGERTEVEVRARRVRVTPGGHFRCFTLLKEVAVKPSLCVH